MRSSGPVPSISYSCIATCNIGGFKSSFMFTVLMYPVFANSSELINSNYNDRPSAFINMLTA